MLKAIQGAQHSITIEAYIYWAGDIGRQFAEALAAKARLGCSRQNPPRCGRLLDDWRRHSSHTLADGGCVVAWYHPIHWYTISRLNNRTHRKSLIIDGKRRFHRGRRDRRPVARKRSRPRSTGATRTFASKVRPSPRFRAPFRGTGSRRPASSLRAPARLSIANPGRQSQRPIHPQFSRDGFLDRAHHVLPLDRLRA